MLKVCPVRLKFGEDHCMSNDCTKKDICNDELFKSCKDTFYIIENKRSKQKGE
jgi:hypothetical protein